MAGDVDPSRRHRRAGAHEGGPGLHLPRAPEDVPADEAGHRRGRGRRHRRWHRDPAGHRHPRRRPRPRASACREARWSLYPMGGSAVRLQRQIPYTVAADILLTGKHILAAEAKEIGLVGYVVPDGRRSTRRARSAATIAANGPLAVEAILRRCTTTEHMSEEEAFAYETGYTGSGDGVGRLEGRPEGVRREAHAELPAEVAAVRPRPPHAGARRRRGGPPARRRPVEAALEAVDLMAQAVERGGDAGVRLLAARRRVFVPRGTWRYSDPGRVVADALRCDARAVGRRRVRRAAADARHACVHRDRARRRRRRARRRRRGQVPRPPRAQIAGTRASTPSSPTTCAPDECSSPPPRSSRRPRSPPGS